MKTRERKSNSKSFASEVFPTDTHTLIDEYMRRITRESRRLLRHVRSYGLRGFLFVMLPKEDMVDPDKRHHRAKFVSNHFVSSTMKACSRILKMYDDEKSFVVFGATPLPPEERGYLSQVVVIDDVREDDVKDAIDEMKRRNFKLPDMEIVENCCSFLYCVGSNPGSKCGHCKVSRYCSRDCQGADWEFHKPVCEKLKAQRKRVMRYYNKQRRRQGIWPNEDGRSTTPAAVNGTFKRPGGKNSIKI